MRRGSVLNVLRRMLLWAYKLCRGCRPLTISGFELDLEAEPRRIVSLVPSWTETLFAFGMTDEIVGITRFCSARGQKSPRCGRSAAPSNPDIKAIIELKPDLLIANAEENRREDIEQLRAAVFRFSRLIRALLDPPSSRF